MTQTFRLLMKPIFRWEFCFLLVLHIQADMWTHKHTHEQIRANRGHWYALELRQTRIYVWHKKSTVITCYSVERTILLTLYKLCILGWVASQQWHTDGNVETAETPDYTLYWSYMIYFDNSSLILTWYGTYCIYTLMNFWYGCFYHYNSNLLSLFKWVVMHTEHNVLFLFFINSDSMKFYIKSDEVKVSSSI